MAPHAPCFAGHPVFLGSVLRRHTRGFFSNLPVADRLKRVSKGEFSAVLDGTARFTFPKVVSWSTAWEVLR